MKTPLSITTFIIHNRTELGSKLGIAVRNPSSHTPSGKSGFVVSGVASGVVIDKIAGTLRVPNFGTRGVPVTMISARFKGLGHDVGPLKSSCES
jgi:hypothetical protein